MKQSGRIRVIILILFFLSGACGLIYEVAWHKMLSLVFGNTTFATSAILASFMGGLALGSFYFGRIVDKHKKPLKLYAYMEIGIGIFAALFPFVILGITKIYIIAYQHFHTTFYLISLIKFVLCFLVLLIPSFLMGGTLPVISKFLVRKYKNLGWDVGSLYGSNTMGGVMGSFLAGFFFISLLGVKETTYAAAVANIVIAIVALGLNRFSASDDLRNETELKSKGKNIEETTHQVYSGYIIHIVLLVYALSGFCALAYEVLWTRTLVFFLSNTIYSFTIMLTTFLFGSALGSLIFAKLIDKRKHLLNLLVLIELLIGLFAIISIWSFSILGDLTSYFWIKLGKSWFATVVVYFVCSFSIMFIPTLLMGIAFPLVIKIYTNFKKIGRSIGNIYSVNTLGCVLGSFAAGFIIIPLIGITKGIMFIAFINLILGIIVLFFTPFSTSRIKYATVTVVVAIIVVSSIVIPQFKSLGLYSPWFADLKRGGKILFYKEGVSATVSVHQWPLDPFENEAYRVLEVNGINVAGNYPGLRATQKLQGHLPLLLYKASSGKDPQNVFILGLGSGESSYSITRHRIKKVDCAELVSDEIDALPYFRELNKDLLSNPKFNLKIGDARNFHLADQENYDVIESDSVHPMIDIYVYTKEYFQICKKKLTEKGIFSTWIPLFSLSDQNLKTLLKTFHSVFPHLSIWFTPTYRTRHALLVGTNTELKIDFKLLQQELQNYEIKKSLEEVGLDDIYVLLNCFITDERKVNKYMENSLINTDNNLYLAHCIPKQKSAGEKTVSEILEVFNKLGTPVFPYLENMGEDERTIEKTLANLFYARKYVIQGLAYDSKGDFENEIYEFEKALFINPEDKNTKLLLGRVNSKKYLEQGLIFQRDGNLEQAIHSYTKVLEIVPHNVLALHNLGIAFIDKGDYGQAEALLQQALKINPQNARIYNDLGAIYMNSGAADQAKNSFKKAIQLDHRNVMSYRNLGRLYFDKKLYNEAIVNLKKAVSIDPNYVECRYLLATVYTENGMYKEAESQLKKILKIEPRFEPARSALNMLKNKRN